MTLYFPTSDTQIPYGGIRILYAAVDALNQAGMDAAVVHRRPGFRVGWFPNSTQVVAAGRVSADPARDVVIITEFRASELIPVVAPGVPKILFNQAPYLTYPTGRSDNLLAGEDPFGDPTILGCITVSVDAEQLLSRLWPWMPLRRVRLPVLNGHCGDTRGLDQHSERCVTVVRRKRPAEASLLVGLISKTLSRGGWRLCYIEGMRSGDVTRLFAETPIFIHLPALPGEGLSLLLLEAMNAGCAVIGYTGRGGSEVMTDETATVIPEGEVLKLAEAVEEACGSFGTARWTEYQSRAIAGQQLVRQEYTLDNFRGDLVLAVSSLLEGVSVPRETAAVPLDVGLLGPPSVMSRVSNKLRAAGSYRRHPESPTRRGPMR